MIKSIDTIKQEQAALLKSWQDAVKENDNEKAAQCMADYLEGMKQGLLAEVQVSQNGQDVQILAARGVRQLTHEEREYYEDFIQAAGTMEPKQALANLGLVMPKTVINSVFEDLVKDHPLLDAINFVNTTGLTEFIVNKGTKQLAAWGKLCDKITKELAGDLAVVPLSMNKLSAWIPVCKSMLILGPEWLDRYVRAILYDALAYGLEEGIINGTGIDMPIGMTRDIAAPHSDDQPYAEKQAVAITDFGVKALGAQLAALAVDRNGHARKLGDLIMIVNPADYYTKIAPAIRALTPGGAWADILPFPIRIVESEQVATNKAILGRADGYFMGLGLPKEGRIEYSDEYKFLEDERTYLIKLLGSGFPKDNTSFIVLDITNVKAALPTVQTIAGA